MNFVSNGKHIIPHFHIMSSGERKENMKRTKEFWKRLTKDERCELVYIERHQYEYIGNKGYLPDDCSECPVCGEPHLGSGLCSRCNNRIIELINKGRARKI